jgi:hypothetical protein
VVVTHSAIQYCLDLILLLAVDESCRWGWHRSSARDGIRNRGGQLDHGEDGVKAAEVVREFEAVCAMADTSIDDKGAQTSVREFRRWSIGGDVTSI